MGVATALTATDVVPPIEVTHARNSAPRAHAAAIETPACADACGTAETPESMSRQPRADSSAADDRTLAPARGMGCRRLRSETRAGVEMRRPCAREMTASEVVRRAAGADTSIVKADYGASEGLPRPPRDCAWFSGCALVGSDDRRAGVSLGLSGANCRWHAVSEGSAGRLHTALRWLRYECLGLERAAWSAGYHKYQKDRATSKHKGARRDRVKSTGADTDASSIQ
ncbi:hypothetical protein K488DRAFT_72715 [Vararia minispora EC-137]|uniref:Uncharacterized protein n=1 Tax=Vararia minispora EC-137 TaxID=1314806 RepID=A0ACB8QD89_9AGAM|nr:hypothetical protein K488DRAFT_72715 [Vararia minispora EC-137]